MANPIAGYTEAARLLDATTLRAMLLSFRGEVRGFEPPDRPDPALIDVVERPFESPADAHDRLSRLETRLRDLDDRRAVFLTIYVRMTGAVRSGIERGQFNDANWMRRYLVAFANYYRRAFLDFERGQLGAVPDPWRIAFGAALRGDSLFIQDSILGVNAHINYDLALSLNDVGLDPNRPQKYADHVAINNILDRLIDAQQAALAELYAAGIGDIDTAFGRLDESLLLVSMTEGREQAWRIAVVMTDVGVPPVASYARWLLRTTATGGAYFILGPSLDPALHRTLRRIEDAGFTLDVVLDRIHERIDEVS